MQVKRRVCQLLSMTTGGIWAGQHDQDEEESRIHTFLLSFTKHKPKAPTCEEESILRSVPTGCTVQGQSGLARGASSSSTPRFGSSSIRTDQVIAVPLPSSFSTEDLQQLDAAFALTTVLEALLTSSEDVQR